MYSMQSVSQNILIATFQLLSATSLNLVSLKMVYSRHSSQILWDVEKNSRQPEFELKNRQLKQEVITRSQGTVKNTFQERGKGVR